MSLYGTSDSEDSQGDDMEMTSNAVPPNSQVDRECEIQQQPIKDQPTSAPSAVPEGGMPIPQHLPNNIPDGLQCLIAVDQVKVKQKGYLIESFLGFEKNKKFNILNKNGQKMFYAVEDTDCCTRIFFSSLRKFEMKILDNQGREIIHLSRPFACQSCPLPWCLQKIKVYSPPGSLVGIVEQDWSLLFPVFTIRNALNEEMLKIKGPICLLRMCGSYFPFKILSRDKTCRVGRISKEWPGLAKKLLTNADNFSISFPMDLDVHMKTVIIGACVLIDFMYFENKIQNVPKTLRKILSGT